MRKITTLGCCDSGLGGLITIHELHLNYPNLNIVYIADQANAPYGDKSIEQLNSIASNIFAVFKEKDINDVLIACNTLCLTGEYVKEKYPEINVHTIIEPTYKQLEGYDFKTINVLATNRTIESHIYGNALSKLYPNALIREIKATKLVPIIENGFDKELLKKAVNEYCKDDADAWVLGCTHYPLIRPYLKTNGKVFDSIIPIIESFKNVSINGKGKVTIYTTKDPNSLKKSIRDILDFEYDVQYIDLKQSI